MNQPQLFTYEPKSLLVTAGQAADLVTEHAAGCHDFTVNSLHVSPDIQSLSDMVADIRLTPADGEAYLIYLCIQNALSAALNGRYGVAAVLANVSDGLQIIETAINQRQTGNKYEFTGHAEMRLVDQSTPYLQQEVDHSKDVACVNLSPCPGCFGHMIDAHFPQVLVGSIDPQVGAAFLKGRDLQVAAGKPRQQVIQDRNLEYRFPKIDDSQLRNDLFTLSWEVFHSTRSKVHRAAHRGELNE